MSPCPSDIKYALIGMALGVVILVGFLALKICMIRKQLFDSDSADLRNANVGVNGKDTGRSAWALSPTRTCSLQPSKRHPGPLRSTR